MTIKSIRIKFANVNKLLWIKDDFGAARSDLAGFDSIIGETPVTVPLTKNNTSA